jgi:hypothetical protein
MESPEHTPYREWLDLAADGGLEPERQAPLERHLAACPECRAELAALQSLDSLLMRSRLPVQPDLRSRVMQALPVAGWEARHPRTWSFPVALMVLLAGAATALLGTGAAPLDPAAHSGWGALFAVAGMFKATLLAGGGLLAASWRGVGMVVEGSLTPAVMGGFALFVVFLNLLLVSLLRRRRELPADPLEMRRE